MILDGKKLRDEILENIKQEIDENKYNITLAIIYAGNHKPSEVYINNKIKYAEYVGIKTRLIRLESTTEKEIIDNIELLNNDDSINGIILQSPVPNGINIENCIKHISPKKDVDGFTKENTYKLINGIDGLMPCTAKGIMRLLDYYDIPVEGKNVCIIGRGKLVGMPITLMMLNNDATVSVCHKKTKNIKSKTIDSDIIILGAGSPKLLTKDMIKDGAVVIDAGITLTDGKVIGDADFDGIKDKCSYITPNPGGVGPMTIAMIIENTLKAYKGR